MTPFPWTCPYCGRATTIAAERFSVGQHGFDHANKHGAQLISTQVVICPNPDCRESEITAALFERGIEAGHWVPVGDSLRRWYLKPSSIAKVFPDYIPRPILEDYEETCLIRDLSPKASATLARRCLQGILRDFWKVKPGRLVDEIKQIKDRTDPLTWEAIDSVRKIGNIGAHMENDINLIVEVDPNEAKLLIGLIETLIRDWYIAKAERQKQLCRIKAIAEEKQEAREGDHGQQEP